MCPIYSIVIYIFAMPDKKRLCTPINNLITATRSNIYV